MTTRYFNPAYIGMTEADKQRQIKLNYYNSKGKLKASIKVRCKRFGFNEELFKDCKTVEELNNVVKSELSNRGYSEVDIKRLFVIRKSTYEPRKPK